MLETTTSGTAVVPTDHQTFEYLRTGSGSFRTGTRVRRTDARLVDRNQRTTVEFADDRHFLDVTDEQRRTDEETKGRTSAHRRYSFALPEEVATSEYALSGSLFVHDAITKTRTRDQETGTSVENSTPFDVVERQRKETFDENVSTGARKIHRADQTRQSQSE